MEPNSKPLVCIVVLTGGSHRRLDTAQAAFCRHVKAMMHACEMKAPAPGGNRVRAVSKPSPGMTSRILHH